MIAHNKNGPPEIQFKLNVSSRGRPSLKFHANNWTLSIEIYNVTDRDKPPEIGMVYLKLKSQRRENLKE